MTRWSRGTSGPRSSTGCAGTPAGPHRAAALRRVSLPAVPDEPSIADLRTRLKRGGRDAFVASARAGPRRLAEAGRDAWDAFPDTTGRRATPRASGSRRAQASERDAGNRRARERLKGGGRRGDRGGPVSAAWRTEAADARLVILSAGAVNSAVLLLRSRVANRSDQVGRNFMNHNCSAVLAVSPIRRNTAVYQKTRT